MTDKVPSFDGLWDRPECRPAREALQRRLDGDPAADTPEAAAHRAQCPPCRDEWLLSSCLVRRSIAVTVPDSLVQRTLDAALRARQRHRQRLWLAGSLSLAASLLLTFVLWQNLSGRGNQADIGVAAGDPPVPHHPPLPRSPSPSNRTNQEDVAANQRPSLKDPDVDPSLSKRPDPKVTADPPSDWDRNGLDVLANAGSGASKSVEPLRSSARRAFHLLVRVADPPDPKSSSIRP